MVSKLKGLGLVAFIVLCGYQTAAEAHTLVGSIPAAKNAVIRYRITCFVPAAQMIFRVKQAKTAKFSVNLNVTSNGSSLDATAIPIKNIWTPYGSVQGGSGDYILELSKVGVNANQAISFTVEDHCDTETGEHTAQSNAVRIR